MDLVSAVALGIIQGVTEFLPISSTGHLILTEHFFGVDDATFGLTFDVAVHIGTLVAVVAVFWRDLATLARAWMTSLLEWRIGGDRNRALAWYVVAGTVPAALAGALGRSAVEGVLRSPLVVAAALVGASGVFLAAEAASRRDRSMQSLTLTRALVIGCAQAVALVPGTSRSGMTIAAGLFVHLTRAEAARFAFVLSVPIIGGAGLLKLGQAAALSLSAGQVQVALLGFVVAAATGYGSIRWLLRVLRTHSLAVFVAYRLALATAVGVIVVAGS